MFHITSNQEHVNLSDNLLFHTHEIEKSEKVWPNEELVGNREQLE